MNGRVAREELEISLKADFVDHLKRENLSLRVEDMRKYFNDQQWPLGQNVLMKLRHGGPVAERNVRNFIRMMLNDPPEKIAREMINKSRDSFWRYLELVAGNPRSLNLDEIVSLLCVKKEKDPEDEFVKGNVAFWAAFSAFSGWSQIGRHVNGCAPNTKTIEEVVSWIHIDEGRLITENPVLPFEDAINISAAKWSVSFVDLVKMVGMWRDINPWTVMLGLNHRFKPMGVSIVLPVSKKCYQLMRDGKKPIHQCAKEDFAQGSPYLILYAMAQRPRETGGLRVFSNINMYLCMLMQVGALSKSHLMPPNTDIKLLCFNSFPLLKKRLEANGFEPIDRYVPNTDIELWERVMSSSGKLFTDRFCILAFDCFSQAITSPPTKLWSAELGA